jgi:RDD family
VLASGRTPGKRWNGLRVVRMGGEPIGFLASAIRNVLRVVDWLPFGYLVGVAAVLVTARNQRVGDVVAGTLVIRERRASQDAPHLDRSWRASVPQEALAWDTSAVSQEEVAAVRSFLERRHEIDLGARVELAATLEARLRPKVAGVSDAYREERFLEALAAIKAARG